MGRRDEIRLTPGEQAELLEGERIVVVSTLGREGWPHVMPLWYVPRKAPAAGRAPVPEIWIYTYAKSQKVRNLERDIRATLLVETGREYGELRGTMIEAEAEIHRDLDAVYELAEQLTLRYADGVDSVVGDAAEALRRQARKRVAIRFEPTRVRSWDHRKLGGRY